MVATAVSRKSCWLCLSDGPVLDFIGSLSIIARRAMLHLVVVPANTLAPVGSLCSAPPDSLDYACTHTTPYIGQLVHSVDSNIAHSPGLKDRGAIELPAYGRHLEHVAVRRKGEQKCQGRGTRQPTRNRTRHDVAACF